MRKDESKEPDSRYWTSVHTSKRVMGYVVVAGAMLYAFVPVEGGAGHSHLLHLLGVVVLALMGGMMIDVDGTTKIARIVVDALPWTPSQQPKQDHSDQENES